MFRTRSISSFELEKILKIFSKSLIAMFLWWSFLGGILESSSRLRSFGCFSDRKKNFALKITLDLIAARTELFGMSFLSSGVDSGLTKF